MKICYIVGAFPIMKCGIGDYTRCIAEKLSKTDNEISVITSQKSNIEINNLEIYNVVDKWNMGAAKKILKILKEIKPDVIHIQYPNDEYRKNLMINFLPYIIRKKMKCQVCITIHEYSVCSILGKIRNIVSAILADKVIVVEKKYINDIPNIFSLKNKIFYIPIFSNIPKSLLDEDAIKLYKKNMNLDNSRIISYFGFINQLKGFELLIDVIRKIVAEDNTIKLLIVGELDPNNVYHKNLLKMIDEYNLNSNVIITGFVESSIEVANYLKISDLCILPFIKGVSERNGSFLAAYIQNIPIITTSFDNNLVSLENKNALSDGVYHILPNDQIKCIEIVKNIFKFSKDTIKRKDISKDIVIEEHLKIYKKMRENVKGNKG